MSDNLKNNMFSGMFWTFLRQTSLQIFAFIEGVILARLLSPSDYGLLAMPAFFMAISGCFIDSGFATALVRKQDKTPIDYSTVFVTTVCLTAFFSLLLCICSPLIADFYNEPILIKIVCANAVLLFLNSFLSIQNTRLTIKMDFKAQNLFRVITNITIGITVIICAFCGMGVWSLVWPNFIMPFLNGYLYYRHDPWFPGFKFSWKVWREFFGYGSKLLASNLITTVFDNIYPLVVGKKFSAANLGYYSKAQSYACLPSYTLQTIVGPVAFPVMCSISKDEYRLQEAYLRLVSLTCYLVFPIIIGLAVLAKPFIIILITNKWEAAIIYLQVLCFASMWNPFNILSLDFFQVKGRSDLFLKLEVLKKSMSILILFISIPFGLLIMCYGQVVTANISTIINMYYIKKVGQIKYSRLLRQIVPSLLYASSMGIIIHLSVLCIDSHTLKLITGLTVGVLYYWIISKLTKSSALEYLIALFKEKILSHLKRSKE